MFGFKKKEPTIRDEKRMLSDHDIVAEIINVNAAKDHYSGSMYKRFYDTYLGFSTNNEKFPTYNSQYKDRVLTITYEFAAEGLDVSKICKENTEAVKIFKEGSEKLEDEAYSIIDTFSEVIDAIADDNNLNMAMCRGFGWSLLHYALKFIKETDGFDCNTERLPCLFRAADNMYIRFLTKTYFDENDPWFSDAINKSNELLFDEFQKIIDNESVIEYCLEKFAKAYMQGIGAQDDTTNYEKLKKIVSKDWPWMAWKYKQLVEK